MVEACSGDPISPDGRQRIDQHARGPRLVGAGGLRRLGLRLPSDAFTADFAHERWLSELERLVRDHGASGRSLLDVACGTGKSFLPWLERGYEVTACDVSAEMLRVAAAKDTGARLFRADMRRLPEVGSFHLVTCLDDALNYLETEAELVDTLRGIRANLAADGLAIWDVNTLAMYRADFASAWAIERDGLFIAWRGQAGPEFAPGERADAVVDVFSPSAGGCWHRHRSEHAQRHWPPDVLRACACAARLTVLAVYGQHRGARIESDLDESVHTKAVFVACRDDRPT